MLGFVLRAEILSQEVLKFALHRRCSNFLLFFIFLNLVCLANLVRAEEITKHVWNVIITDLE